MKNQNISSVFGLSVTVNGHLKFNIRNTSLTITFKSESPLENTEST